MWPALQKNYTQTGFVKMRMPQVIYDVLGDFLTANADQEKVERWSDGKMLTNHWESPSGIINWDGNTLLGGAEFRDIILFGMNDVIRLWIGETVAPAGMYGIRIYKSGAMVSPRKFNAGIYVGII